MKIKRVIVDELPEGEVCSHCTFWRRFGLGKNDHCALMGLSINLSNLEDARPNWCPLEVEEEKENE